MLWDLFSASPGGLSLLDLVAVGFLVIFGANLGSFLNVVAYRVPQGMSVVFGGSHCPICGRPIRPWHNLPVVGWLLLGGRCHDCLAVIPFRYPLVEALAAVVIGSVSAVELLSGGLNLPMGNEVATSGWWRGVDQLLLRANWRLVAICLLHVTGLATLLAWALIERDRQRLPAGWWLTMLGFVLGLELAFPWLQPAGLTTLAEQLVLVAAEPLPAWQAAGLVGLCGMLAGWLIGRLLHEVRLTGPLAPQGMALVGGLCGWQATLTTALIWFMVSVGRSGMQRVVAAAVAGGKLRQSEAWPDAPPLLLADLVAALTLQLLTWRWLDQAANGLLERIVLS